MSDMTKTTSLYNMNPGDEKFPLSMQFSFLKKTGRKPKRPP